MAAVTVDERIRTQSQESELVLVTASDGETLEAQKLGTVTVVRATLMEDTATLSLPLSCALSGSTVTLHCTGLSDVKVLVEFIGTMG